MGQSAKALALLLVMVAGIFASFMVSAGSANALDLTASGEVLNVNEPFSGDGQLMAKDPDEDIGGNSDISNNSTCSDTGFGRPNKATNCLPIFRWAMKMNMISNVEFTISQPLDSVSSNLIAKNSITGLMTIGNLLWYVAALLMDAATNYEIATAIMKPINEFAKTIGTALLGSALLGLIVGVGIVSAGIAFMRRGFDPKRLLIMGATLGVLSLMIGGSMADKGSGDGYVPGVGSPAWIAKTTASTFKSIADPIADSVSASADKSSDAVFSSESKDDPYSCYTYAEALYSGYTQNSDGGSSATAIMSRWWMNTSYKTFAMLQYGDENTLGADYALCHQLELGSVEPSRHSLMNREAVVDAGGSEGYTPDADKLPMIPPSSQGKAVQVMNFWGLCAPGGYNDGENFGLRVDIPAERNADGMIPAGDIGGEFSGGGVDENSCGEFAGKTTADDDYSTSWTGAVQDFFKSGDNADAFKEIDLFVVGNSNILNDPKEGIASVPELYDYEGSLTGADRSVSPVVAAAYMISAIVGAIAMALLAIALFVMKTLSYVMAGFLILAVIAGTISQGTGSSVTFFKQWLGYTFITSITNLLMSFVFLMSAALNSLGASIFSQAIPLVLWAGLVPALSIFLLNWVFKKFFKAASPFSMRGMQSYANNPMGVAATAATGGALLGDMARQARGNLVNRGVSSAAGLAKGAGKGADGSAGATEDSEVIGKAADAPAGSEEATSPKDAVAAGAAGVEGVEGVEGAADTADGTVGAGTGAEGADADADSEAGAALFGGDSDDEVIGNAEDGGAEAGSLGDRINAFADGAEDRKQGRHDAVSGAWNSAKYAAMSLGGNISDKAGALGQGLASGASAVAHPKATMKAGMDALKGRWDSGAGTRQALREHPGAAASYLARRSAVNLGKLAKGTVDTVSGMDKKSLLKGAALYGGLTVATGGLAAPAAVFGAKSLLKHKGAVAGGFKSAKESIVQGSKQAYGNYFPGGDEVASEMQFRELNKRIDNAKVHGVDGQPGVSADGSEVVGLGADLPLGRERMIDAERENVEREFDVFAANNGRAPDEREMEAIYARNPFANDVRDQSVAASQGELDLGAPAVSGHSNAAAAAAGPEVETSTVQNIGSVGSAAGQTLDGGSLQSRTVQGQDINREANVAGRNITQRATNVSQTQGPDTEFRREIQVEHDVNTTVNRAADQITRETTNVNTHTPGQNRIVDDVKSVGSGRGAEQINESTADPKVTDVDNGSYQVGSGAEAASIARRAGISEQDAAIVGEKVEEADRRGSGTNPMRASAIDIDAPSAPAGAAEALDIDAPELGATEANTPVVDNQGMLDIPTGNEKGEQ